MKNKLVLLLSATIALYSCSSVYKSSQTPDDVYYSPAREVKDYQQDQYEDYTSSDDRYLRMKVHNYNRWAAIDDYNYWYDSRYYYNSYASLGYGYYPYYSFNSFYYNPFYNPYSSWYYPYCTVVYYKNPTVYFNTNSRTYLAAYRNNNYSNSNINIPLQNGRKANPFTLTQNNNTLRPVRTFNSGSNNNSGGRSGGFKSTGGSTSTPRPPRSGGGGN